MKTQVAVLMFVVGITLSATSSTAQAQIPITRGGTPVFRAAYFSPNGPQPFSTRRTRELQAARSQGLTTRGTIFTSPPQRTRVSQSAWRPTLFSRRYSRRR